MLICCRKPQQRCAIMNSQSWICTLLSYSLVPRLMWINTGDADANSQLSRDLRTWPGGGKETLRHCFAPFLGSKCITQRSFGFVEALAFVLSSV